MMDGDESRKRPSYEAKKWRQLPRRLILTHDAFDLQNAAPLGGTRPVIRLTRRPSAVFRCRDGCRLSLFAFSATSNPLCAILLLLSHSRLTRHPTSIANMLFDGARN